MLEKEIELRRRKIEELKLKGYSQRDIAEKLGVTEQTISADVKELNERYKKLVIQNPQYLEKRVEKILEWLDKYDLVLKQLYDLKEGNTNANESITSIVNRFLPELNEGTEEEKRNRLRERGSFKYQLNSLAKSNTIVQTSILREVRQTLSDQTKILQLVTGNKTYIQQNNYVHIAKVEVIFERVNFIIQKYIPEDKKLEVYTILKSIDLEGE